MRADSRTLIGIDPGKHTGIAIYRAGALCELHTLAPDMIEALLVQIGRASCRERV